MNNTPPLETLASYAIAFSAGAVSTLCVAAYGDWMRQRPMRTPPFSRS